MDKRIGGTGLGPVPPRITYEDWWDRITYEDWWDWPRIRTVDLTKKEVRKVINFDHPERDETFQVNRFR
jgi:hypothetical protein